MKKWILSFACILLCVLFCACGDKTVIRRPMDADVSFTPTVYYGEDGVISFLYDRDHDMLSTVTGQGVSVVALYSGGDYSLVISYEEVQKTRKEAEAAISADFSADGSMTLSEKTEKLDVSGYTFRWAKISSSDGSYGAVLYGNTANGYAEIYYIISSGAKEGTKAHLDEILSSIVFGAHTEETEGNVYIYAA